MALGSTQPLTEIRAMNIFLGGKSGRCVGLTTLPSSCTYCLEIWDPNLLQHSRPVIGLFGDSITFTRACRNINLLHSLFVFYILNCQMNRSDLIVLLSHNISKQPPPQLTHSAYCGTTMSVGSLPKVSVPL